VSTFRAKVGKQGGLYRNSAETGMREKKLANKSQKQGRDDGALSEPIEITGY
jgi:hypothetical protein